MPEECCCICHDPTGIPSKDWRAVYRSIDRFCSALVCSVYCLARYEPLPVLMSCIPQILVNFFWMFHLASTLLCSVDDIVAPLFHCVILLSQYPDISCKLITCSTVRYKRHLPIPLLPTGSNCGITIRFSFSSNS